MPKLLVFAPCEKIIVAQEDNTVSLVSMLENVSMPVPAGTQVPGDAVVPIRWAVMALWLRMPEDDGRRYTQHVRLIKPDGQESTEIYIDFRILESKHRNVMNISGFPVGQVGTYRLQLALITDDDARQEIAEYPIEVQHSPQP